MLHSLVFLYTWIHVALWLLLCVRFFIRSFQNDRTSGVRWLWALGIRYSHKFVALAPRSARHSRPVPHDICHFLSLTSNILLIIYDLYMTGHPLGQLICARCPLRPVAESGRRVRLALIGLRCFHTAQLLIIFWLSLSDDRSLNYRGLHPTSCCPRTDSVYAKCLWDSWALARHSVAQT